MNISNGNVKAVIINSIPIVITYVRMYINLLPSSHNIIAITIIEMITYEINAVKPGG